MDAAVDHAMGFCFHCFCRPQSAPDPWPVRHPLRQAQSTPYQSGLQRRFGAVLAGDVRDLVDQADVSKQDLTPKTPANVASCRARASCADGVQR